MKKIITLLIAVALSLTAVFAFTACGSENDDAKLSLYAPDGAPALSVARLLNDETTLSSVDVKIVEASTIQAYVTGENPKADFAIMPVNAASKILGTGNNYQMLGVVTHGNLFLMKKQSGTEITLSNLDTLKGKKVGVINLANVPGLTFKAILSDNDIEYVDISESGAVKADKVNLIGLSSGTEVTPASDCDYFVVPEPAATTKANATQGKLAIAASLQDLYGAEGGYPQAVLVVKKQIAESKTKYIKALTDSFAENVNWLKADTTLMTDVVAAVQSGFVKEDTAPTFTANNLNANVIENCAIEFVSAFESKTAVLSYLAKLNAISNNAWGTPADSFFYISK